MIIERGAYVYARHGTYIGVVEAASDSLMRVRATEPVHDIYYVPTSAIIGTLAGGREVFLSCTLAELSRMGWLHAPERDSNAGPEAYRL